MQTQIASFMLDLPLLLRLTKEVEARFSLPNSQANMVVSMLAQHMLNVDPETFTADPNLFSEKVALAVELVSQEVVDECLLDFQRLAMEQNLCWSAIS